MVPPNDTTITSPRTRITTPQRPTTKPITPGEGNSSPVTPGPTDSVKLTANLPPELQRLRELAEQAGIKAVTVAPGSKLIEQGKNVDFVYILIKGNVDLFIKGKKGEVAKRITIDEGLLGEISARYGIEPTGTLVAGEGVQVLAIPKDRFNAFLAANREIANYTNRKIESRLVENGTWFFSHEDISTLYPEDRAGTIEELPNPKHMLSLDQLRAAYQRGKAKGVAELITRHVINIAKAGDSGPLRHWMRAARGQGTFQDVIYIFHLFPTGQLHLHPTRSLPLEFIAQLGTEKLPLGEKFWDKVNGKVKGNIKNVMNEAGYKHIQELFQNINSKDPAVRDKALQTLKSMIEYNPLNGKGNLNDYLSVNSFTSSFYTSTDELRRAAFAVAEKQYREGVRYLELRFGPDQGTIPAEDVIRAQIDGLREAEKQLPKRYGGGEFKARAIVSFFTTMSAAEIEKYGKAIEAVKRDPKYREYLVGVDICGPEVSRTRTGDVQLSDAEKLGGVQKDKSGKVEYYSDINKFAPALRALRAAGLQLTIHAGENFLSIEQGQDRIAAAIEAIAPRLGHATVLGMNYDDFLGKTDAFGNEYTKERIEAAKIRQQALLKLLAQRGIVVEVCLDSNTQTAPISVKNHPFRMFLEYGDRVAFSSDNATTSHTTGAKQILDAARSAGLPLSQVLHDIIFGSTAYGFSEGLPYSKPKPLTGDLYESEIPAQLKLKSPEIAVNNAVAYIKADGTVLAGDAYLIHLKGGKVPALDLSKGPQLLKTESLPKEIKPLAHNHEYLYIIPVKNAQGQVEGYISIGTDDASIAQNGEVTRSAAQIEKKLAQNQVRRAADKTNNPAGSRSAVEHLTDSKRVLEGPAPRLAEVVVNVPAGRVNSSQSRMLLKYAYQQIADYARSKGYKVEIYIQDNNFVIRLKDNPGEPQIHEFMREIRDLFAREKGIEVRVGGYLYDEAIDNPGAAKGESPKLKAPDLELKLSQVIKKLEAGTADAGAERLGQAEIESLRREVARPAAAKPSTPELPAGLTDFAEAMGIKQKTLVKLNEKGGWEKAFSHLASKMNSQKLIEWMQTDDAARFLSDPEKRKTFEDLLAKLAKVEALRRQSAALNQEGLKVLGQHTKGVLVGLITLFGAEKLANIFGINDPVGRFVFVLGLSHTANSTALRMFQDKGMQKAYTKFINSSKFIFNSKYQFGNRFKVATRPFSKFSVNMVKGLAEMAVIGNILKALGVNNEYAIMVGSFVIPAAWRGGAATIKTITAGAAAKAPMWKALRMGGRALGWISTITWGFDTLHSLLKGDYEKSVELRLEGRLRKMGKIRLIENQEDGSLLRKLVRINTAGLEFLTAQGRRIFMPQSYLSDIANGRLVVGGKLQADSAIREIWKEDELLSGRIKDDLAWMLAPVIQAGKGYELAMELTRPVEWEDLKTSATKPVMQSANRAAGSEPTYREVPVYVNGKKVFEFARQAMARHGINSFNDNRLREMVKDRYKISDEQYDALVPKFFKASIQEQFALLHSLVPFHGSTNSEIRRMFNKEGTLRIGSYKEFIGWVEQKGKGALSTSTS